MEAKLFACKFVLVIERGEDNNQNRLLEFLKHRFIGDLNMQFQTKKIVTLAALVAIIPLSLGILAPTQAGPTSVAGSLIDVEFEGALRKFVIKRFCNRIQASDEQKAKINQLAATTQEDTRAQREELRQGLLSLSDMMANNEVSDEAITKKAHELREIKEQVMDRRLKSLLELRKILTAEQRQQVNNRLHSAISGGLKGWK